MEGKSERSIAEQFPSQFVMYHRGFQALRNTIAPPKPRDFKTEVYVYIGPTGTGKSRKAAELAAQTNEPIFYKARGNWWDGYKQQENVIIDDFYGWLEIDELLKITDRYPYQVPVKGSYEVFNSKRIWITSNKTITTWYPTERDELLLALIRRITQIEYF